MFIENKMIERIKNKYPDKIPFIIEDTNSILKKNKFIVHPDCDIGRFVFHLLNEQLKTKSNNHSICLMISNKIHPPTTKFKFLYDNFKNDDDILYGIVIKENTFG